VPLNFFSVLPNSFFEMFITLIFSCSSVSVLLTWLWLPETLPVERRGAKINEKTAFSFGALFKALAHPQVGLLLVLVFAQQIAFGGFEQLLPLFTLNRMGLDASGNAVIFVFVGIIVVAVQGGLIGPWSRKYGDRKLVYAGLTLLAIGLILTAMTPQLPPPGYSKAELQASLSASGDFRTHENPTTRNLAIELPEDTNTGWAGLIVLLIAMIPAAIGGGVLQPSINSLITKRVDPMEVGGMLGISAALLSGANAIAPLLGGTIYQALGPAWPFLLGGVMLALLMLFAIRSIRAGREEMQPAGLARAGAGH